MAATFQDLKSTFIVSFILRIVFMVYGEWQDAVMVLKYTDIDYQVFSDAAKHVALGNSPYDRPTYRYTPLLAWLLVPNILLHKAFGKLLFVLCDMIAGYLIILILRTGGNAQHSAIKYSWFWLFNPMIITVSTRGNAESLLAVLVLSTIYFLLKRWMTLSAIMLAISVHFKIYPVIYALPLYLTVGWYTRGKSRDNGGFLSTLVSHLTNRHQVMYAVISGSTFLMLTAVMYYIYGFEFIEQTYLYHVTRKDVKHNFSIYFYLLYLTMDTSFSWMIALLAFLPQFFVVLVFGVKYYKDLPFCCFIQTFAFVTFNKVCTSQYFLWYLSLFPLVLPQMQIENLKYLKMLLGWGISQAIWLFLAYLLEFKGYNTFLWLWTASVGFFSVNVWILSTVVVNHVSTAKKKSI